MTVSVDLGLDDRGAPVTMDLEELLATRLLVQGNSGSGKSHLLRRLLERSAGQVQQVVIDPEGDFVTLAEAYGHVGMLIEKPEDVEPALREARKLKDRTVFMDFRTDPTENVFPMVKAGMGITEMLLGSEDL